MVEIGEFITFPVKEVILSTGCPNSYGARLKSKRMSLKEFNKEMIKPHNL